MGNRWSQEAPREIFVPVEQVPALKKAVEGLYEKGCHYEGDQATPYEAVQNYFDWHLEEDVNGNITNLYLYGEHKSYGEVFLEAIAPFLRPGSFVELRAEDGEWVRHVFFHGDVFPVEPTVTWDTTEIERRSYKSVVVEENQHGEYQLGEWFPTPEEAQNYVRAEIRSGALRGRVNGPDGYEWTPNEE